MSSTDVIQRKIDTWNAQDRAGYLATFADDARIRTPDMGGSSHHSPADFYDASHRGFPESTVKAESVHEAGDTLVVEWLMEGTNSGPLSGPDGSDIPATGRRFSSQAVGVYTIRDGRIAGTRYYWDNLAMLGQLGLL